MGYYDYWNEYYDVLSSKTEDLLDMREVIEDLQKQGYQTYDSIIDGGYNKKMFIYEHVDPIDGKADDFRAICLDEDSNIHWGNVIDTQDGRYFIAITNKDWNGAYNKYKIRELDDDMTFNAVPQVSMKCAVANKGFYDETSYTNEANVFEDKDLRAAIIQYNENTKKLTLFDDVYINNEHYRIVKIDNYTLKEYDEEFGVIQLVIVDTPFGTITKNNTEDIKGVMLTARVKDKILNSISLELYSYHNKVRRGDYVDFTYDRDKQGSMVTETYLVINKPSMETGYDKSLLYLCENVVNMLNSEGKVVKMPLYFEDNRTRIDKEIDGEFIRLKGSSYLITLQDNEFTQKLTNKVNRVIIKGKAYRVTGFEDLRGGLIDIGLEIDQITPDDNEELGVANYYSQMEEINGEHPPEASGGITGDGELYLGYANEYVLEMPNICTWSVNNPNVMLTDLGENKCELLISEKSISELNKTVILTARIGSMVYEKSIKIVNL